MNNQIDATEIKILDTRSLPDKKGKIYAIIILVMIALGSLFALSLDTRFVYLLVYLWFGTIYGLLLQYGRFCMASAVRDLFAVGVPRMAVGVMIAVALYSLTAAAVTATTCRSPSWLTFSLSQSYQPWSPSPVRPSGSLR